MPSRKLSRQAVAKQIPLLKVILKIRSLPQRRALLTAAGPELVDAASSIARNILSGAIPIRNPALRKTIFVTRRKEFDALASLNTPHAKKLKLILRGGQKGGFLGALIGGLASAIPAIIGAVSGK